MNYIFYQTKTKHTNAGDVLINKALISELRSYGKIRANCGNDIPDSFLQELGVLEGEKLPINSEAAFAGTILKEGIKALFNGDRVYVFSGLGHIYGQSYKRAFKNLVASALFGIYRVFGIRVIRLGFSIGPVDKSLAISELIRSLFVSKYYVRDSKSLELCHEIGIRKAMFCPDMAWLYSSESNRKLNSSKTITISLKGSVLKEKNQVYIDALIDRCGDLLEILKQKLGEDMKVYFIYQVTDDREFNEALFKKFSNDYNAEFIDRYLTLDEVKSFYDMAAFNISNRMHSLLLGYKYGALPIALIDIENHLKISSTFDDSKISSLMLDVYDFKDEDAIDIIENRDQHYEKLIKKEVDLRKTIISEFSNIFEDVSEARDITV